MAGAATLQRLLLLLLLLTETVTHAMVFDVPSGRVKCISEELRSGAMSVAHYRVVDAENEDSSSGANRKVSTRVSDPNGETVHVAEAVDSGRFAFVAGEAGSYMACFWSPRFKLSASVAVDFEWRSGIAAREWPAIVKKSNIQVMAMELKKLEDSVSSIQEELIFLHEREEETERLNESTNSKMGILTLFSLIICLGVAGLQFWYLKVYFERLKIL